MMCFQAFSGGIFLTTKCSINKEKCAYVVDWKNCLK